MLLYNILITIFWVFLASLAQRVIVDLLCA